MNAYWENHYYLKHATQNYLGCTSPNADSIAIEGFAQEHNYVITYFPTRMNSTPPPADTVVSTLTGTVTLDLTATPFGDTVNNYLDTLHTDYAFIIAPELITRGMLADEAEDTDTVKTDWDFALYPNPANEAFTLALPSDDVPRDVILFDMAGKRIFSRTDVTVRLLGVTTTGLSKGTYAVRVSDAERARVKILVIH